MNGVLALENGSSSDERGERMFSQAIVWSPKDQFCA